MAPSYRHKSIRAMALSYRLKSIRALFCFSDIYETVEHGLPPKKSMSPVGFDTGTSRIVSHHSTNCAQLGHRSTNCAQLVER
jgi:hypothetical protein